MKLIPTSFADCDSGNSNKLVGNRKVREGKYSLKNVTLTTDKYFSGLGSHKKSCISFLLSSDLRKQIFLCKQLKRLDFGVSLPGWMGKQHIRRQCCYVLFSDAESFSYKVFLLKSKNTFCYTPKRIWIHVHPCTWQQTGTASCPCCLLIGIGISLITAAMVASDSANTEATSVSQQKNPRSQHHSFPVSLGAYLLPVFMWGSQTRHTWAQVGIHCRCCNQNFTW